MDTPRNQRVGECRTKEEGPPATQHLCNRSRCAFGSSFDLFSEATATSSDARDSHASVTKGKSKEKSDSVDGSQAVDHVADKKPSDKKQSDKKQSDQKQSDQKQSDQTQSDQKQSDKKQLEDELAELEKKKQEAEEQVKKLEENRQRLAKEAEQSRDADEPQAARDACTVRGAGHIESLCCCAARLHTSSPRSHSQSADLGIQTALGISVPLLAKPRGVARTRSRSSCPLKAWHAGSQAFFS